MTTSTRTSFTRRQLLAFAGAGAAALTLPACDFGGKGSAKKGREIPAPTLGKAAQANPELAKRTLVLIELTGGNDGLATLVPVDSGEYRRLRPGLATEAKDLIEIDGGWGLHSGLGPIAKQLAVVQGLGTEGDDLSHFSMLARWWRGDSDAHATGDTGFLGRCCDQLSLEQPIVGLSLGRGASPALQSEKAPTVSLPLLDAIQGMGEADNRDSQALRTGFELLTKGDKYDSAQISWARQGLTDLLGMVDVLRELPPQPEPPYPGGELGQELMRAARLIRADAGMRIIHIPWGDFDTHEGQRGRHDGLMNQFGNSVAAFMADLAKDGRAGDVLVATTSEFGRRPASNSSGTDHGGASVAMLVGPVVAGRHGQAPSLRQFDRHDNLVTTTTMSEYYATLASWFGIPASDVLSNATNVKPLAGMLA